MRRASLALTVWVLALVTALLASGCTRRPTQLLLVVDSDLAASSYACIGIDVARLQDTGAVAPSQYVSFNVPVQAEIPFSLGVIPPGDDASVRVEIRVEARARCEDPNVVAVTDPPVVRTVIRAGFAREQALRLPVFLAARCTGVVCAEGQTCDPDTGMCMDIVERDPSTLMPVTPGEELMDAGVRADGSLRDASVARDANLDRGQCPLVGDDHTALGDAPNRVFGLAITHPAEDWVVVYSEASALRAFRYPIDRGTRSDVPAWSVSEGADAIALEGLPSGNMLLALINPAGSSELVRYVGPVAGSPPVRAVVGSGRLVARGRHSVLVAGRLATVVERGAGVAVVSIGAADAMVQDVYVSPTLMDIALGTTAEGALIVARSGASACTLVTYDAGGAQTGTHTVAIAGGETCRARAVTRLEDGSYALVYAHSTQLRLSLSTSESEMSLRLNPSTHVAAVAEILGHDDTYRVAWSDRYDYPGPPDPGPDEPGIIYQTDFAIGSSGSQYTDHGDPTTDHDLTRWERYRERTAAVMVPRNGFLFRSICRPTPDE